MTTEIDFDAAGLLDGLEGEAREARLDLLRQLAEDGAELSELKAAVSENRLALLPVERVLSDGGTRYTPTEVAERAGMDLDELLGARQALGLPRPDPDERVMTEEDLEAAHMSRRVREAGMPREASLEVARAVGRGMAEVAVAMRASVGEAFARPGDTERDVGLRYAEAARQLVPEMSWMLRYAMGVHLREQVRQDVVDQVELEGQGVAGSRMMAVGFADLVGFTRLGEELDAVQLGGVARRLTELAGEVASTPVRLIKMIGDAAMLVSPEPEPLLEAALALVAAAEDEGAHFPQLRAGLALGEAVGRAGDWYGRPVNLASRITAIARPGSVLTTSELHVELQDGYAWSFAHKRRLRGIREEVPLYRARRLETDT